MNYQDDIYEVQVGDLVEVTMETGRRNGGEVVGIQLRKNRIKVRYEDSDDLVRTTGEPRKKTAFFDPAAVELERRQDS